MTREEWLTQMRSDSARLAAFLEHIEAHDPPSPQSMTEWVPSLSPVAEARVLVEDCANIAGVLQKDLLTDAVCDLVKQRNRYMVRLGLLWPLLFKDL